MLGESLLLGTKVNSSLGCIRSGDIGLRASQNSEKESLESPSRSNRLMIAISSDFSGWCPILLKNSLIVPSVRNLNLGSSMALKRRRTLKS